MYHAHYNLKMNPFDNSPDPRFFYASEDHCEALAAIEYTILMRKGMVLISGEIGAGKTTVSHTIQSRIEHIADVITLHQGIDTPIQLIKQLCRGLQIKVGNDQDRSDLLAGLEQQLLSQYGAGKPVVVVVDEAQVLSVEVLDEIRLLSNIETRTQKLLQFVLIGQPEIRGMLELQELQALRQRIVMAHHLGPLKMKDVRNYVSHRLSVASGDETENITITDDALSVVYQYARGIPRLINCVLDSALLVGYARETHEIHQGIILTVIRNMLPERNMTTDVVTNRVNTQPNMIQIKNAA